MNLLEQIENYGLVPVARQVSAANALSVVEALQKARLDVLEVSCASPEAVQCIEIVHGKYPDMLVGAAVTTLAQLQAAVKAGACFITTPAVNEELVKQCQAQGTCIIPGCATPADVERARSLGLKVVKVFPVSALGGVDMLSALAGAYPDMRFIAEGGVNIQNLEKYLHTPGVMAVAGNWILQPQMLESGDFVGITKLARQSILAIFNYVFQHVGINYSDVPSMEPTVFMLADMFNLKIGDTGSSTFVSEFMEISKEKYRGDHGHIGFRTDDIVRSVFYFQKAGFEFEEGSTRFYKEKLHVIYFKERWGGFAWHLQTNNTHNPPRWEEAETVLARGGLSNKYIGKK